MRAIDDFHHRSLDVRPGGGMIAGARQSPHPRINPSVAQARVFNAFFGLLLPDGNLLLRGVGTLILSAPLLWLYARAKRSVLNRRAA
jgi:hypothetical protein